MSEQKNDFSNSDIHSSIGFLAGRIAHRLRTEINSFLANSEIPLSSEEYILLTALEEIQTPKRMGELAVFLQRDATTLKRQLNPLIDQALVLREPCPQDNRAVVISITKAGKSLVQTTYPLLVALRKKALNGIPPSEQEALIEKLSQVLSNLSESA